MNNDLQIRNSTAEFLIFATQNESDTIEVRFEKETLWLSQKWMAKLFDCTTDNISLHLKNIFSSGELEQNSVTEDFSATATDGKNYRVRHYNLDAIIAVGYRVNSRRATQFRASHISSQPLSWTAHRLRLGRSWSVHGSISVSDTA